MKSFDLKILFPSKDCGEKCSQFYLVTISVSAESENGDKISKSGTFILKLLKPPSLEETSSVPTGLFNLPSLNIPMVSFATLSSNIGIEVAAIIGSLIFLGLAILWRVGKRGPPARPKINSMLKRIKSEIKE